jgi:hypothetical protein
MGLFPKLFGGFQRVDFESFPPRNLIAGLMQLPMMPAAERDREFITNFKTDGSRLCKAQRTSSSARIPTALSNVYDQLMSADSLAPCGHGCGRLARL